MEKRIKMNSASLQEGFPEIYRDFFSKYPLVLSTSGSFWFTGEYSALYGGLSLFQKLPLKVYIGIYPISKSEIIDDGGWAFVPSRQKFEPGEQIFGQATKETVFNWLNEEAKRIYGSDDFPGFRMGYLQEIPIASGLNSSAATSVGAACALLLTQNKLFPEDIKGWVKKKTGELIKDEKFDKAFRLAWKIESIFHRDSASGGTVFSSFLGSDYPICFFTEQRPKPKSKKHRPTFPPLVEECPETYDKLQYQGFKIEEIEKVIPEWPIDFGLIYSGDFMSTAMATKSVQNLEKNLDEAHEIFCPKVRPFLKNLPSSLVEDITKNKDSFWRTYVKSVNAVAAESFCAICDILENGVTRTNLAGLTDTINVNQNAIRLLDASSPKIDVICGGIVNGGLRLDELVGCKITGAGKKGDVFFATSFHGLRDSIFHMISKLRNELGERLWLDYASWIDGIGGDEARIEQDLDKKIYSSFISSGMMQVRHLAKDGRSHARLYTMEYFESKRSGIDLLIDLAEGDMFVRGKKLGSKDLHTARETINILKILIENMGKYVKNTSLPRSSYAAERGEFQSKILTPLNKTLKKYLGKCPDIKLSGGQVDFSVKLTPGFDIYLIEKMF